MVSGWIGSQSDKKTPVSCRFAHLCRHTRDTPMPQAALPPEYMTFGHETAPPRPFCPRRTMKFFGYAVRFIFISDAPFGVYIIIYNTTNERFCQYVFRNFFKKGLQDSI
jgi:hypothetical protein